MGFRIQLDQRLSVRDGLLFFLGVPQQLCKSRPCAHVAARLQDAPEVPAVLLEELGPEPALGGLHRALVELLRRLGRVRQLREQDERVRAIGVQLERPICELALLRAARRLVRVVHQVLRPVLRRH